MGLQTGLPPFHLLELRRDEGAVRDAVWYLDQEFGFAGNALDRMESQQVALLRESLIPLLSEIRETSLLAPTPATAAAARRFSGINPRFAGDLVCFVVAVGMPLPQIVRGERFDQIRATMPKTGLRLASQMLERSLAPSHAAVSVVSPFTGTPLPVQEAFAFGHERIRAWRCHDPAGDVAMYLLARAEGARALYIPAIDTIFTNEDGVSGAQVLEGLLCHYALTEGRPAIPLMVYEDDEADGAPADEWIARAAAAETIDHAGDLDDASRSPRDGWLRRLFRPGA